MYQECTCLCLISGPTHPCALKLAEVHLLLNNVGTGPGNDNCICPKLAKTFVPRLVSRCTTLHCFGSRQVPEWYFKQLKCVLYHLLIKEKLQLLANHCGIFHVRSHHITTLLIISLFYYPLSCFIPYLMSRKVFHCPHMISNSMGVSLSLVCQIVKYCLNFNTPGWTLAAIYALYYNYLKTGNLSEILDAFSCAFIQ